MEKNKISVLFGTNEVRKYDEGVSLKKIKDNIYDFQFDTNAEKNAFLLGLETALGWEDFIVIEEETAITL